MTAQQQLYSDSRAMIRNGSTTDSKRTVAMTVVRALETDKGDVGAMLPLILELYLRKDPAEIVAEAIEEHHDNCGVRKMLSRVAVAVFGAGAGGGLLGYLIHAVIIRISNRG